MTARLLSLRKGYKRRREAREVFDVVSEEVTEANEGV
jgi:hypothetical protein